MASTAREDVEILVHTTAPSRGQDDERYRALARAYLAFEPKIRRRLHEEPYQDPVEDMNNEQAGSQLHAEVFHSTQDERESAASYRPDNEQDESSVQTESLQHKTLSRVSSLSQILNSPELSFNSAIDNANSPTFRGLITCRDENGIQQHNQSQNSADSWHPPPSTVADSQPEIIRPIPAFSSPTRLLELYLQQFESSQERSPASNERRAQDADVTSPRGPLGSQNVPSTFSGRVERAPSIVSGMPSSSPLPRMTHDANSDPVLLNSKQPPATQDPDLQLKRKWPELTSDEANISSSTPSKSFTSSSISAPAPSPTRGKRHRTILPSSRGGSRAKAVRSSKTPVAALSSAEDLPSVWQGKLEVKPTPPATSNGDLIPEMLVTKSLQHLAQKMSPPVVFRPRVQSRDLRPMERGHWLVSCKNWDAGLRSRCWDCLGNYIGRDLAGWGVWCVRDEQIESLRVYCWGRIVGHIYLLLYMASESKIKNIGARWVGGDGEAIIRMQGG